MTVDGWQVSRVAVVHSFYSSREPSGENRAVEYQIDAMKRARISVRLVSQRTDDREQSPAYRFEAAATVATGLGRTPLRALREFEPDIVHVHNLFPNFGRRWVEDWDGPIVATLHNFRTVCAAGTFYRAGNICTLCAENSNSRSAVRFGCYRESHLASLPVAAGVRFDKDPLLRRADRVIAVNQRIGDSVAQYAGVPRRRIATLPNFLPSPGPPGDGGDDWLFVGRLSAEKGILELVRQWPREHRLTVIGDGPLRSEVESAAGPSVTMIGTRPASEVGARLRDALGLVVPSRWFEGCPLVYLEALSAGTPVLAWDSSTVADLVQEQGSGAVVRDGDLKDTLDDAATAFPSMRTQARAAFDDHYTERVWMRAIADVYSAARAMSR
ncbi:MULTISPECIES: glycosyltransferase [unclassified Nocardioides]|uniref:glycosyltransferase n=1 Tax=unclassified Nocardioides TaxID=2615069 RepID=UPI000A270666